MGVTIDWYQYPAVRAAEKSGEAKGLRKALVLVLEQRFGALPEWAQQKIEKASEETAMGWLAKVGEASKLTELIPRR